MIQHDGVVYGAAFDDSMRVTHHRASTKQQVTMLRGSKYVQSDIRLVFQQIIDDLKNETSKEIIENMKIIFEGNVNIVPKK